MTVPAAEDKAYDFTLNGPNGFESTFRGVLDCRKAPERPVAPEP
ncbi:hypothetical protein ACFV8T_14760 [Streptomyces sp. NPDC059832]